MATFSIRIPDEIAARLETLSLKTGRTKSFYIKEAVLNQLEDIEDYYIAEQRLAEFRASGEKAIPLAEVMAKYGL